MMAHDRQRSRQRRRVAARVRETHTEPNTSWRENPFTQRTVGEGWDDYARKKIPASAPSVAYSECRRAFYGGAWHLLGSMVDAATDLSADAGAALFEARRVELEMFTDAGVIVEARVRELGAAQPETVMAGWRSFEHDLLDPAGAAAVQRAECRKAFFAGAHQMFRCFADTAGVGVPEEEGAAYIEARRNEVARFYEDVIEGRA